VKENRVDSNNKFKILLLLLKMKSFFGTINFKTVSFRRIKWKDFKPFFVNINIIRKNIFSTFFISRKKEETRIKFRSPSATFRCHFGCTLLYNLKLFYYRKLLQFCSCSFLIYYSTFSYFFIRVCSHISFIIYKESGTGAGF